MKQDVLRFAVRADGKEMLAPHSNTRYPPAIDNVDWSKCGLARQYGIPGETNGGPRRRPTLAA